MAWVKSSKSDSKFTIWVSKDYSELAHRGVHDKKQYIMSLLIIKDNAKNLYSVGSFVKNRRGGLDDAIKWEKQGYFSPFDLIKRNVSGLDDERALEYRKFFGFDKKAHDEAVKSYKIALKKGEEYMKKWDAAQAKSVPPPKKTAPKAVSKPKPTAQAKSVPKVKKPVKAKTIPTQKKEAIMAKKTKKRTRSKTAQIGFIRTTTVKARGWGKSKNTRYVRKIRKGVYEYRLKNR